MENITPKNVDNPLAKPQALNAKPLFTNIEEKYTGNKNDWKMST